MKASETRAFSVATGTALDGYVQKSALRCCGKGNFAVAVAGVGLFHAAAAVLLAADEAALLEAPVAVCWPVSVWVLTFVIVPTLDDDAVESLLPPALDVVDVVVPVLDAVSVVVAGSVPVLLAHPANRQALQRKAEAVDQIRTLPLKSCSPPRGRNVHSPGRVAHFWAGPPVAPASQKVPASPTNAGLRQGASESVGIARLWISTR